MKNYMTAREVQSLFGAETLEKHKTAAVSLAHEFWPTYLAENEARFVAALDCTLKRDANAIRLFFRPADIQWKDIPEYNTYYSTLKALLVKHFQERGFNAEFCRGELFVTWSEK